MSEKNIIYLDYQATTPVRPEVLKAMMPYFKEKFGNPHSNNHSLGKDANLAVNNAKKNIGKLINCEPEEIIFTSGATEFIILQSKVLQRLMEKTKYKL